MAARFIGIPFSAVVLIAGVVGCTTTSPQSTPTEPLPPSASPISIARAPGVVLRELADRVVGGGTPGISIAWTIGGRREAIVAGVGRADAPAAVTARDHVRIGSITKTYVATLALLMQEGGDLDLGESVDAYLPGVVPNGGAISLRMLLNHTSGLFDYADLHEVFDVYRDDPGHIWRAHDLIALAMEQQPYFAPGAGWHYANTNYVVLGLILEHVGRKPLAELFESRLFGPLALEGTSFATNSVLPSPAMHGYITDPTGRLADVTSIDPSEGGAAGAIVSTPTEVARFLEALLGGRILKPTSLAEMESVVPVRGDSLIAAYGLGIYQIDAGCGTLWGHDGEIFGFMSFAYATPDGKRSFATTTSLPGDPWWLRPALQSVFCDSP